MSLCHDLRVGSPTKPATVRAEHQGVCTRCPLPIGVTMSCGQAPQSSRKSKSDLYLTPFSFSQHHNSHETSWPRSLGDFENERPSSPGRAEHGWGPSKTQPRELWLFGMSVNSLKISTCRVFLSNKS